MKPAPPVTTARMRSYCYRLASRAVNPRWIPRRRPGRCNASSTRSRFTAESCSASTFDRPAATSRSHRARSVARRSIASAMDSGSRSAGDSSPVSPSTTSSLDPGPRRGHDRPSHRHRLDQHVRDPVHLPLRPLDARGGRRRHRRRAAPSPRDAAGDRGSGRCRRGRVVTSGPRARREGALTDQHELDRRPRGRAGSGRRRSGTAGPSSRVSDATQSTRSAGPTGWQRLQREPGRSLPW